MEENNAVHEMMTAIGILRVARGEEVTSAYGGLGMSNLPRRTWGGWEGKIKGDQMKEVKIDGEVYVRKDDIKNKTEWEVPKGDVSNPFMEVGKDYFLRTVTHYFTGRLVWVGEKELAFEEVAWIADTGRFNEFLEGKTVNEVEPFPKGSTVLIGRGALIDMVERKCGLLLAVK